MRFNSDDLTATVRANKLALTVVLCWACDATESSASGDLSPAQLSQPSQAPGKQLAGAANGERSAPAKQEIVRLEGHPRCPPGMALVPARTGKEPVPEHKQDTPLAEFCFDLTEVTVVRWGDCVLAGACEWPWFETRIYPRPWERIGTATWIMGNPMMPMNYIDRPTAEAFCKWAGRRLPTEAEWRWAFASARADYTVPWGEYHLQPDDDPTPNALPKGPLCRSQRYVRLLSLPCPAASNAGDVTEQGIFDMAGNLQEWTSTSHFRGETFYVGGDPFSRKGAFLPASGGFPPDEESVELGVRCAGDPRR